MSEKPTLEHLIQNLKKELDKSYLRAKQRFKPEKDFKIDSASKHAGYITGIEYCLALIELFSHQAAIKTIPSPKPPILLTDRSQFQGDDLDDFDKDGKSGAV